MGGTVEDDRILFTGSPRHDAVRAQFNGERLGAFEKIDRVAAYGQAGDDVIVVSQALKVDSLLDGGAGNDMLVGGSQNDILIGAGDDDHLFGGSARDVLVGGRGGDFLWGGFGDDILVSAATDFDSDREALDAIMAEWTSNRMHQQRADKLTSETAEDLSESRANENDFLLAGETVENDGAGDRLFDPVGRDLPFG